MPRTILCLPRSGSYSQIPDCLAALLGQRRDLRQLSREFSDLSGVCDIDSQVQGWAHPCTSQEQARLLELSRYLDQQAVQADSIADIHLCQIRNILEALSEGKQVHAHLINNGLVRDIFIANNLIAYYANHGSVEDAWIVFNKMHLRNVVSWTSMITAYAQHGDRDEAIQLFQRMQMEGFVPNKITVITVLNACCHPEALLQGKIIHAHILERGFESDVIVGNALVNMYGKCGSVEDARMVFDKMHSWYALSWHTVGSTSVHNGTHKKAIRLFELLHHVKQSNTSVLNVVDRDMSDACVVESVFRTNAEVSRGCTCSEGTEVSTRMFDRQQQGLGKEALQRVRQMQMEVIKPNVHTYVTILHICSSPAALSEGKMIHACVAEIGLESDIDVGNALVSMYGRCGGLKDAWVVFCKLPKQYLASWNAMIRACAHQRCCKDALDIFRDMKLAGLKPDEVTFTVLLSACSSPADLPDGKMIHAHIARVGLDSNFFVSIALLNMYYECGNVAGACMVSDKLHQQGVISWTSMMAVYDQLGHSKEAIKLFWKMQKAGLKPNVITFVSILSACANALALEEGYSQHQLFKEALCHFQQMLLEGVKPTEITLITLLSVCASSEGLTEGKRMHVCVGSSGFEVDVAVANAIVNMYGKCASVEDAQRMFDRIHQQTVVSWTAIITAYVQSGQGGRALELFQKMQDEGVEPNEVTFVSMLSACASMATLGMGKMIHACIVESGLESENGVCSALLNMYCKSAIVEDAQKIFDRVENQTQILWNGMLAVYAQNGYGKEAVQLFQKMQQDGIKPNDLSLMCVLFACSHFGLVKEGSLHFLSLDAVQGLRTTSHYGCIIDLLGRAGQLDEAEDLINNMPFKPGVVEWMALLGACRKHGDVERGQRVAGEVFGLDLGCAAAYVMLSNIYAAAGKWIDAANIRKMMLGDRCEQASRMQLC